MNRKSLYIKWKIKELEKNTFLYQKNLRALNMPEDVVANNWIADAIRSEKPFCLLRPGKTEYGLAMRWDEHIMFGTNRYRQSDMFFEHLDANIEWTEKWVNEFEQDLKDADIFAAYGQRAIEENYLIDAYAEHPRKIWMSQIESHYEQEKPWLKELEGKKVLVISPFTKLMRQQYERKDLIWGKWNILPDMDMKYLKAVWYMNKEENDGFENWFDALNYMKMESRKIDFDIALIGCGPFSSFLAADFKRRGKQAIQYGGALQLLFGIRGERWDKNPQYQKYYNEYWTRPGESEKPKNIKYLDDGCYW